MSNSDSDDIFEVSDNESPPPQSSPEPKKIKKKVKREMTPERKKQLLENLAKGREKARENKLKKSEALRIVKRNKKTLQLPKGHFFG